VVIAKRIFAGHPLTPSVRVPTSTAVRSRPSDAPDHAVSTTHGDCGRREASDRMVFLYRSRPRSNGGRMTGYTTTNPTTGRTDQEFPTLDDAGVQEVLRRSHAAFPGWRSTSADERASILTRVADAYDAR